MCLLNTGMFVSVFFCGFKLQVVKAPSSPEA